MIFSQKDSKILTREELIQQYDILIWWMICYMLENKLESIHLNAVLDESFDNYSLELIEDLAPNEKGDIKLRKEK